MRKRERERERRSFVLAHLSSFFPSLSSTNFSSSSFSFHSQLPTFSLLLLIKREMESENSILRKMLLSENKKRHSFFSQERERERERGERERLHPFPSSSWCS